MFRLWDSPAASARAVNRREMLRVGSLLLGGVTLGDLLRVRALGATAQPRKREASVIQIFLGGGPSHIDTYDLKPQAPVEIRGEFAGIATRLPGYQIGELLPHMAQVLDRVAVVRSVAHSNADHLPASHWMMTGHDVKSGITTNVNPACGALVSRARGPNRTDMPAYVSIPKKQLLGGAAYLGTAYNPFTTGSDAATATPAVQNLRLAGGLSAARLADRQTLRHDFDRLREEIDRSGQFAGIDRFTREALDIVTSSRAQEAFDFEREPAAARERYGQSSAGRGCLLARRLVEAGATFVTVLSGGEWDSHVDHFPIFRKSMPPVEQAVAALVADLYERGLDQRVMVMVTGEFGRTPQINRQGGRDHWPGAFTVLFSGGGLRVGQVVGSTDERAAYPITHPYSPGDALATLYNFLEIDTAQEFLDRSGRPIRLLPEGKPIAELLA